MSGVTQLSFVKITIHFLQCVALNECLVLNPPIPAALHTLDILLLIVLCPRGFCEISLNGCK